MYCHFSRQSYSASEAANTKEGYSALLDYRRGAFRCSAWGLGARKTRRHSSPSPEKAVPAVRAARLFSPDPSRDGSSVSSRGTSLPSAPSKHTCSAELRR